MNLEIEKNEQGNFKSVILKRNLKATLKEMRAKGYRSVILNSAWGWVEDTPIDFLLDNQWIEGVEIISEKCDITPINQLKNLRYLNLTTVNITGHIDLENFPNLEFLQLWWKDKWFSNLDSVVKCRFVCIDGFPYPDLKVFSKFRRLKELLLNRAKIQSLAGIEECLELKNIEVSSAPQLCNIDLDERVARELTDLHLEKCKGIESYKIVESMRSLETLYLEDTPPIHSVEFLRNMKKLRYANIGTAILDRNVSFLLEKGLDFKYARSYKDQS